MMVMMIEMDWGFEIETRIRIRVIGMEICIVIGFKRGLRFIIGLWIRVDKGIGIRTRTWIWTD